MSGKEQEYIVEVFCFNWIVLFGLFVNLFEVWFVEYVGVKSVVVVSLGMVVIYFVLWFVGVKKGDVVFCFFFMFVVMVNLIVYEQVEFVFIDLEWEMWNMLFVVFEWVFWDVKWCGRFLKVVIVVNFYG